MGDIVQGVMIQISPFRSMDFIIFFKVEVSSARSAAWAFKPSR